MATWDDMERLTHEQAEVFTWGELERLTGEQIDTFASQVWPLLKTLSATDRQALKVGLLDGSLPPGLVADSETRYTPAEAAALSLYSTYKPKTPADMAAYLAVVVALISIIQTHFKDDAPRQPPPATVIIVELPEPPRPSLMAPQTGPAKTNGKPPAPIAPPAKAPRSPRKDPGSL